MRHRKRHPLDVPTPVAIAVADFCRRAKGPVDPRTVRDALSLLEAEDDLRVLALTIEAPAATPLGPYAVVEIVSTGASAYTVARREEAGEWEHVELAEFDEVAHEAFVQAKKAARKAAAAEAEDRAEPAKRRKPTVKERISPKVRRVGEPKAEPGPKSPSEPLFSTFRKRNLPAPRGRYTRVDTTKMKVQRLLEPHMREELEALILTHGHRAAVRRALEPLYVNKDGGALVLADVEAAILHHGLRTKLWEREKVMLVSAVTEARGDLYRSAMALGMTVEELDRVALSCGAEPEINTIREHHAREALAHGNLRRKLELLDRPKYLADLKVEKRFRDALALELKEVLDLAVIPGQTLDALLLEVCRREALPLEKLKTAVDRAGLSHAYRGQLSS